jgi:glycosyltransferase involved in cell wall biosynthesis
MMGTGDIQPLIELSSREEADDRTPTVSVIIPHFSDLRRLDICLDALERQSYPRDDFEIIVSDNNSPEGIAAVEATVAGRARLTLVVQKGPGPARNGAIELARGRILAFTDSDCIPERHWLAEGVAALARFDFVGGQMKVLVDDPTNMTAADAFETVYAFQNRRYVERLGWSVTANLFAPRAIFDDVGGFFVGTCAEDVEWCHRARDKGYRLGYAADSVIGHPSRRTWGGLIKKTRRETVDQFGHATRNGGGRIGWLIKNVALPFSAPIHSLQALLNKNLRNVRQRLVAIAVLHYIRMLRAADGLGLLFRS